MPNSQKKAQKDWYNDNRARCSLDLAGLNNQSHFERLKQLIASGATGGTAIEIGCGNGWYYGKLGRAIGIDISVENIKQAVEGGMKAAVSDAENLPFHDNTFSLAYGFAILHHLEDIEKGLKEIYRVLKPGGYVAFGSENNAACPMNYLFPIIYGNWHIEKGFVRISPCNMERILKSAGFTNFKYELEGFAIYGMGKTVYRITRWLENILSQVGFLKKYAGFMYFTAQKPE